MAAVHHDAGVAVDFTGGETVDAGYGVIALEVYSVDVVFLVFQSMGEVHSFTLATAVEGVADEAVGEGDEGGVVDVAVLAAAIDGSSDALVHIKGVEGLCRGGCRGVVDGDDGGAYVAVAGHRVAIASLATGATEDVAVIGAHGADAATGDVDMGIARGFDESEHIRPAESEAIFLVFVLGEGTDGTDVSHGAATVDVVEDMTA